MKTRGFPSSRFWHCTFRTKSTGLWPIAKFTTGFTLIELLVVISIIGLLSSVVLSSLNVSRKKARDGKRIATVKQLQTALDLYYDKHGEYPDTGTVSPTWARSEIDEVVPPPGAQCFWCDFESNISEFISPVPRDLSISSYKFTYKYVGDDPEENGYGADFDGYGLGVNLEISSTLSQNDGGILSGMYEVGAYPGYCKTKYGSGFPATWHNNSFDVCGGGN